jgi:hypothetical protein
VLTGAALEFAPLFPPNKIQHIAQCKYAKEELSLKKDV